MTTLMIFINNCSFGLHKILNDKQEEEVKVSVYFCKINNIFEVYLNLEGSHEFTRKNERFYTSTMVAVMYGESCLPD